MPVALLRHGDVRRPVVPAGSGPGGRVYVGQLDVPLSALGRAQAHAWAGAWRERLGVEPPPIIHASDLSRTAETAAILAAAWGVPVRLNPAWREIRLGAWEGLPMAAVQAAQPALYAARGADPAGVRPPGGEHFGDLARRVLPAFAALEASLDAEPSSWALVVTHAGVIRTLRRLLSGMPLTGLFADSIPLASLHVLRGAMEGSHVAAMLPCPLDQGNQVDQVDKDAST